MPASAVATIEPHDGLVDVSFSFVDMEPAGATRKAKNAAAYLWLTGRGPTIEVDGEQVQKPLEDLTNQEIVDMLMDYWKFSLGQMIESYLKRLADEAARALLDPAEFSFE